MVIGADFQGFEAKVKISIPNKYNGIDPKEITIKSIPGKAPVVEE